MYVEESWLSTQIFQKKIYNGYTSFYVFLLEEFVKYNNFRSEQFLDGYKMY